MAFNPLGLLARATRAVYSTVRLGVARLGATVSQVGQALTRAGVAIEASQLRRLHAAEVQLQRQTAEVLGVADMARPIDPVNIPEGITRQLRDYAWRVRLQYIDRVSGLAKEKWVTVSTDQILSPDEAIAEAEGLGSNYEIDSGNLIHSELMEVTRAAPGRRI